MRGITLLKNSLVFICLVSLVIIFYLQTRTERTTTKQSKPQEYMTQLTVSNFTAKGNAKEILTAEYWEFLPEQGCSDLVKPHVTVYKPNGDVWHLFANKAIAWHPTINDKVTKIDMKEGVIIERPALNNVTPIKVETLAMEYTPENDMITSKEYVSMQQPGLTISGFGMRGYLDRNWIELHDRITTIYTPKAH